MTLRPHLAMGLPFRGYSTLDNDTHFASGLQAVLESMGAKGIILAYA